MQDCDHQTLLLCNYEATAEKNPEGGRVSKRNTVLNSDEDTNFISSFHGCKEEKEKGLTTTFHCYSNVLCVAVTVRRIFQKTQLPNTTLSVVLHQRQAWKTQGEKVSKQIKTLHFPFEGIT